MRRMWDVPQLALAQGSTAEDEIRTLRQALEEKEASLKEPGCLGPEDPRKLGPFSSSPFLRLEESTQSRSLGIPRRQH